MRSAARLVGAALGLAVASWALYAIASRARPVAVGTGAVPRESAGRRTPLERALDLPENTKLKGFLARDHEFVAPPPRFAPFPFAAWTDDANCIRSREGDVKILEAGCRPRAFRVSGKVDAAAAEAIEAHFGIDPALLEYHFLDEPGSREAVAAAREEAFRRRGLATVGERIQPDYGWLVAESLPALNPLAREIVAVYSGSDPDRIDDRGVVEALTSFVQNAVPYRTVEASTDGRERGGIRSPLSTLFLGGDCDCKALLLAGLIRSVRPTVDLAMLHVNRDEPHACLGVAIPAGEGEGYVRAGERDLLVIETTDDWDLGRLSVRTDLTDAMATWIE
jgi:hypothetical protein